ncbi:hypothetical protein P7K49_013211 [Saguinus oedipus]|uniref:Uncharacterized protein n=1 Tax=Saguinus oedipus TaxID=9490 RepID=A0ABQ9VFI6_SAGOE|nr:hypothetical protein P7K49_013211 [Saguinus oedipus]
MMQGRGASAFTQHLPGSLAAKATETCPRTRSGRSPDTGRLLLRSQEKGPAGVAGNHVPQAAAWNGSHWESSTLPDEELKPGLFLRRRRFCCPGAGAGALSPEDGGHSSSSLRGPSSHWVAPLVSTPVLTRPLLSAVACSLA